MADNYSKNPDSPTPEKEIFIMDSIENIKHLFLQQNLIIYIIDETYPQESQIFTRLQEINATRRFTDLTEASDFMNTNQSNYFIITSPAYAKILIDNKILMNPGVSALVVFDFPTDDTYQKDLLKKNRNIVSFSDNLEDMINQVKEWQLKDSRFRLEFPSFSPIFNNDDKSDNYVIGHYLNGFTKFANRDQAKKEFLDLARQLYVNAGSTIEFFNRDYKDYNMVKVLNWYTKQCFLFKFTNMCLRIANVDTIQYSRFILKDLEAAVKDRYKQESWLFNGLVYRGTFMPNKEWDLLKQNCGKEIEMFGFLSTSKSKDIALNFILDKDSSVLITIVVPAAQDQEGQGFADVQGFSVFPEEEEVIFNVRSRFTILATSERNIEKGLKQRNLVLLYGAQEIRRFGLQRSPTIETKIKPHNEEKCKVCLEPIESLPGTLYFTDLSATEQYFCNKCVLKETNANLPILLCLTPLLSKSFQNMKIQGLITKYNERLRIPFYGSQCETCKIQDMDSLFECKSCQDSKKRWCRNCFNEENQCIKAKHLVVLQNQPFTFWTDRMSQIESSSLEKTTEYTTIGDVYMRTHHYDRAESYFTKRLELVKDKNYEETLILRAGLCQALIFSGDTKVGMDHLANLSQYAIPDGIATINPKSQNEVDWAICFHYVQATTRYQNNDARKAIEHYEKALLLIDRGSDSIKAFVNDFYYDIADILEGIGKDDEAFMYLLKAKEAYKPSVKDLKSARIYQKLGKAYSKKGKFQDAIEHAEKALKIQEEAHGSKHLDTADCYEYLAEIYEEAKQYEKALDSYFVYLKIIKSIMDSNVQVIARAYYHIGKVHIKLGHLKDAEEHLFKGLEILSSIEQPSDHIKQKLYRQLAELHECSGEFKKSLEYHTKIQELFKGDTRDLSLEIAFSNYEIAKIHAKLGNVSQSIAIMLNALKDFRTMFGEKHYLIANCYQFLGQASITSGEYQKAIKYTMHALRVAKTTGKEYHINSAYFYEQLGTCYLELGKQEKSFECNWHALEIRKRSFGDIHVETANGFKQLLNAYEKAGQIPKAIECCSNALRIITAIHGEEHPETEDLLFKLGELCYDCKCIEKAIKHWLDTLKCRQSFYGDTDKSNRLLLVYNNIASAYSHLGQVQKALEYASKAWEVRTSLFGPKDPETAYMDYNMGKMYEKVNQTEKAAEHFLEFLETENKMCHGREEMMVEKACNSLGRINLTVAQGERSLKHLLKELERKQQR